jgi:nicotinamidase-related amidase
MVIGVSACLLGENCKYNGAIMVLLVIDVQHDDGLGSGFSVGDKDYEIADQVAPIGNERIFTKTVNSCFGNPDFVSYLQQTGTRELMIVGLQTNFCIDATVKSAFDRDYKVIVPAGCKLA